MQLQLNRSRLYELTSNSCCNCSSLIAAILATVADTDCDDDEDTGIWGIKLLSLSLLLLVMLLGVVVAAIVGKVTTDAI